jgi:hypothetical protein
VLGFAPELNLNRLCLSGFRRKTVNDVLMNRFVAILSRFVEGPIRSIRRDARVSAGFVKGKGTNTELREKSFLRSGRDQPVVVGRPAMIDLEQVPGLRDLWAGATMLAGPTDSRSPPARPLLDTLGMGLEQVMRVALARNGQASASSPTGSSRPPVRRTQREANATAPGTKAHRRQRPRLRGKRR